MKRIFHITFLLISLKGTCQLSPQQIHKIDSLKNIIKTAQYDTMKIVAYQKWDDIIYVTDSKLDLELSQKIIELARANLKKYF
jgi:hypothetical protein